MLGYGYCRYSSDMQDEKSIEQQKMEINEYAQKNNIEVVTFYCDEAKSGTKDNRDSFQNMISDASKIKTLSAYWFGKLIDLQEMCRIVCTIGIN